MSDAAAERFEFVFPVWTLAYADRLEHEGLPEAIAIVIGKNDRKSITVFTDEDLALRFVREHRVPNVVPVQVESPASFREWRSPLEGQGVTHVQLDPTADRTKRGWQDTLAKFIADLREGDDGH